MELDGTPFRSIIILKTQTMELKSFHPIASIPPFTSNPDHTALNYEVYISFLVYCPFFQVSTLVQVVGIIICLHAATRISHRAQGVVSLASRWHALVTCSSSDPSQLRSSASTGSLEAANRLNSIHLDYSESDLESLDYAGMPTNTQLATYMSSHHKRQAFGT